MIISRFLNCRCSITLVPLVLFFGLTIPCSCKAAPVTGGGGLTISLDGTFPEKLDNGNPGRKNFDTVAHDVLQVVQNLFQGARFPDTRPIVCYLTSSDLPITDATSDHANIRIGLVLPHDRLENLDYNKFAYQLAHELGHVILNPLRTNGAIETLCDAISYQTLDDLSLLWSKKYADFKPWADYAPSFQKYRMHEEEIHLRNLPVKVRADVTNERWSRGAIYLKDRQPELDANLTNDYGLALRSLGARALRSEKVPWSAFVGIGSLTTPTPIQDNHYRDDLPIDIFRAPAEVQAALHRIGL